MRFFFTLCFIAFLTLGAHAQNTSGLPLDFEDISPNEVENMPPPADEPETTDAEAGLEEAAGVGLVGIKVVASVEDINVDGVEGSGVEIIGLPLLDNDDFRERMGRFWGKAPVMDTFNAVTREIVLYYREKGFRVVDAILPRQKLSTGVLQILVVEGKLNNIQVEGTKWFSEERIAKQVRLVQGEKIPNKVLQEDLDWLNENPFRSVQAVFERGEEVGQTDLTLRVNDRYPLRFYGGFDDSGNASTGDERLYAGFNAGNFLKLEHQLRYRYTTSSNFTDFKAQRDLGIFRFRGVTSSRFLASMRPRSLPLHGPPTLMPREIHGR